MNKTNERTNELYIYILYRMDGREQDTVYAYSVKYFVCCEKHTTTTMIIVYSVMLCPFHIELLCWCIMCLAIWSRERLSIVSRYQYNRLKRFVWMERMNERISQPNNQPASQPTYTGTLTSTSGEIYIKKATTRLQHQREAGLQLLLLLQLDITECANIENVCFKSDTINRTRLRAHSK